MAWSKLTDMAMTEEERADYGGSMTVPEDRGPEYPWGLRICLSDAEMDKLGLDPKEADVGDMIDMRCFAIVTSVSMNQRGDGTNCARVELQIQKLAIESEMDSDE